jgi:hypothetical protein
MFLFPPRVETQAGRVSPTSPKTGSPRAGLSPLAAFCIPLVWPHAQQLPAEPPNFDSPFPLPLSPFPSGGSRRGGEGAPRKSREEC